jgi:thiol:disulfide interchange protein
VFEGPQGKQAFSINSQLTQVVPAPSPTADASEINKPKANAPDISIGIAIVFAVLGGLILNIMPCVLPVLSLKVVGLIEHEPSFVRRHVLAFSTGVWASFMAMAGVLIAMRSGGESLGWGFQMQSPMFVAILCLVMFALALSMAGVVHFGSSLGNLAHKDDAKLSGAFFNGVIAALVASPCTAPMMVSALGFALTQPSWVIVLILSALALGFALPMLVLAIAPQLARLLPKPGAWMQTFKLIMALPLFIAAIWLLWVFGSQRGVDAMALLLISAVLLGFGLMFWENARFSEAHRTKWLAYGLLMTACYPAWIAARDSQFQLQPLAVQASSWTNFSPAKLEQLRASRTPVLVEMTAAWCITCKVNEKIALSGETFFANASRHGVQLMKGDWTNQDKDITKFLRSYGHSGVPLVVVYGADGSEQILPQILTPDIVHSALQKAAAR